MKKRNLLVILTLPILLTGCSGFKKVIHPIDWFKTQVLHIEDVTIDAQDLAELPGKMKNFTANIHQEFHSEFSTLFPDTITDFIFKFNEIDEGEYTYSIQPYEIETTAMSRLEMLELFASKYPNLTPTDELIGEFINETFPDTTVELEGSYYILQHKELGMITNQVEFLDYNFEGADKFFFDCLKTACSTGYFSLHYNSKGKYYEPNVTSKAYMDLCEKVFQTSVDYHLYFKDNLLTKVDATLIYEHSTYEQTFTFYDYGTTTVDHNSIS